MKLYALSALITFSSAVIVCSDAQIFVETTRIKIVQGDITKQRLDVIVNAANCQLNNGGGVCGAIFNAAGADLLQKACDAYPLKNGIRCPTGEAKITESFNLKNQHIKYLIHAVGPDCRIIKDTAQRKKLLAAAYENSLLLAKTKGCKSIAFPFISASIYACPAQLALETALETIKNFAKKDSSFDEIRFVLFSKTDFELFKKALVPPDPIPMPEKTWREWLTTPFARLLAYATAGKWANN